MRSHARAVRHRCLRCPQIARLHGIEQPLVCAARAGCGGCRRLITRCLHTCARWKRRHFERLRRGGGQRCWAADLGLAPAARGRPACCGAPAGRAGPCDQGAARIVPGCRHGQS
eukprot:scaffold29012_cov68-Phaeocystis_antarctica.AAC.2